VHFEGAVLDYRAMSRLAQDADRVRSIARAVLQQMPAGLPERGYPFLEDLKQYDGTKSLSTRQQEFFYMLIQLSTKRSTAGPYRASTLIAKAFDARLDLVEYDDEEWIVTMRALGPGASLSNGEWKRLLAICRELDLIYRDEWVTLAGSQWI